MPGFFGGLVERRDLLERDWMRGTLLMPETASGRVVGNENQALAYSAFWSGVSHIATTVGTLPGHIYQRLSSGGKQKATDHPYYSLLHDAPNPWMTNVDLFEAITGHLVVRGNAYLHLLRTGRGIQEVWPLRPDRVRISSSDAQNWASQPLEGGFGGQTLRYFYRKMDNAEVEIPNSDIIHIRGFGFDGIRGYSLLQLARESIGLGLTVEEYLGRFFSNGVKPGGFLQTPGKMDPEDAKRLKQQFEEGHRGTANSFRIAVLEEGLTWQKVGMDNQDAQVFQLRNWQVTDIARWLRMPSHMLGDLSRSTNNNIEQQALEYLLYCLRPWLVRIEKALNLTLFGPQSDYFFEFNVDGLLRGDAKTRYATYAIGRNGGWLCVDDIRDSENMNPLPNGAGQIYLQPLNMEDAAAEAMKDDPATPAPAQQDDPALAA